MQRQPIFASNGVVATSQPLAAQAGLAILREGGNAVDAAIATAITLTVVQPTSNDIGSDVFAQVWDGTTLHGLNGSGRTPQMLSPHLGMQDRGWLPVTVPGAPAAWRDLSERFGRLPFERLFADAIRYAEQGFPVSPVVAAGWAVTPPDLPECRGWTEAYGPPPAVGELRRSPAKARALRLIADSHADEFYRGEIAAALDAFSTQTGGLIRASDLSLHTSEWVEPLTVNYRGHTVHELPPNGQGIATLQALSLLDGLPGHGLHEQIEAMKLGFADTHAYAADGAHLDGMLEKSYVDRRRDLIGKQARLPEPGDPVRGGTVYLATADADGMMVSFIQSNYMGFGSYVVVPEYGFGLQNRGADLSLDPSHPNAIAPGKRPFHTIIPGFLSRDGAMIGPFGVMGGHMQPQGHLQLILATVDDGLDPQAALARPRWRWESGLTVRAEQALDVDDITARGHHIVPTKEASPFGMGQAIWQLPNGTYIAGSEPRADGQAAAF